MMMAKFSPSEPSYNHGRRGETYFRQNIWKKALPSYRCLVRADRASWGCMSAVVVRDCRPRGPGPSLEADGTLQCVGGAGVTCPTWLLVAPAVHLEPLSSVLLCLFPFVHLPTCTGALLGTVVTPCTYW